jgi:uncharacterized protein (TIGR02453 family)
VTARTAVAVDGFAGFPPAALAFLRGLAEHNEKPWFEAHRADYEAAVKAPTLALVDEVDARLAELAPEFVGDRKRSPFRIYRDVRFSKDKRPYKTNAGCWFFHRDVRGGAPKDAGGGAGVAAAVHGGAGFYFHLEPGASFCAGGLWMPPRPALALVRQRIVDRPGELPSLVAAPGFARRFGGLSREAMLVRTPRGYAADGATAEWLRYQSFAAMQPLADDLVTSAGLADELAGAYAALLPLARWLNLALGLRPAERR